MIRKAQVGDYQQIERIMKQVHQLHVSWRPDVYCNVETVLPEAVFEENVKKHEVLVYVEQDNVIGIAFFKEREVSGEGRVTKRTLFVDTMAVLEGHRGKGIGHALFDELKRIVKEQECEGIELQVNARNEKARKMYRDYGFQEKSINMEIYF